MIHIAPSYQVAGLIKQANVGQDLSLPSNSAGWSFTMALIVPPVPPPVLPVAMALTSFPTAILLQL